MDFNVAFNLARTQNENVNSPILYRLAFTSSHHHLPRQEREPEREKKFNLAISHSIFARVRIMLLLRIFFLCLKKYCKKVYVLRRRLQMLHKFFHDLCCTLIKFTEIHPKKKLIRIIERVI